MTCKHFRATRAYEAVQGLPDLFNIRIQNDVQDFDTRWDQSQLAASETPAEMVLEGLYVKIAGFCSASDCIGSL